MSGSALREKINVRTWLFYLVALLFSSVLFFLLSACDLPQFWIEAFSQFSWAHFLGLILILFLTFQLSGKIGTLLGAAIAALVFVLPLSIRLSTGLSNATVLAGFIPYKDGFYYYNGANMLLSGQAISAGGLQGAFRPLFPALLSSLLYLTGQNLLLVVKIMVLATGLCTFLAARAVKRTYGPLPGAVFFTLVFAFIRPMLGDTLTELPGLAFACLALVLLLEVAHTKNSLHAVIGGIMLVLALSIRAGAFFMLPFLILWWGWLHRTQKKLVISKMVVLTIILLVAFLLFNMLLPRLMVAANENAFGNFSWMLYGQAVGGAGFKYHEQALGTSDSSVVLQAALEKIRTYPQGFLIGSAKAFRDFFSNTALGMFDLLSGEKAVGSWLFWGVCLALLIGGLLRSLRHFKQPENALLFAGFLGVMFSIPFLPPVDGGNRFYAGSVPFLFALLASALSAMQFKPVREVESKKRRDYGNLTAWLSDIMLILTVLLPLALFTFRTEVRGEPTQCAAGTQSYTLRYEQGSYVDILPDEGSSCASSPNLCLSRFSSNGMDRVNDDFYVQMVDLAAKSENGLRFWAAIEQNSDEYYFIAMPLALAEKTNPNHSFNGCAALLNSQYQRLLLLQTMNIP